MDPEQALGFLISGILLSKVEVKPGKENKIEEIILKTSYLKKN